MFITEDVCSLKGGIIFWLTRPSESFFFLSPFDIPIGF